MTIHATTIDSPLGQLLALADADDQAITALHLPNDKYPPALNDTRVEASDLPVLVQLRRELDEYFAGKRQSFDVKCAPKGTAFQRAAWAALTRIPYGQTCSYLAQAKAVGKPAAARAIGAANARNPIAIVVPCHRVIGSNGALTGYASGLNNKAYLLSLEREHLTGRPSSQRNSACSV